MLRKFLSSTSKVFYKNTYTPLLRNYVSNKVIGIDLGTTFSCVSVLEGKNPRVIENSEGRRTTPSWVSFEKDGTILVGELARRQAVTNSVNTVYASKRLIGRKFLDDEIQMDKDLVSYNIVEHSNGDAWIKIMDKEMSPSQIGAYILTKMKETAEDYLGDEVLKAVITVPAYFDNSQKQATKDAGQIAGLDVLRIINEPTAAAMAYGLNESSKEGIVVVFDLGGGTFDVSILDIQDGVFEVKATNGDTHLGGEDFDNALVKYLLGEFEKAEGIDLSGDSLALQRIKESAEKAKIELSSTKEAYVSIPFITANETGPKNLDVSLTRAKFEGIVGDLVERTIEPCKTCMRDAKVKQEDIIEVILVGGQTRMPKVQEVCEEIFGRPPCKGVNPDEVVAMGACIQGAVLGGEVDDIVVIDTAPLSLGIETLGGVFAKLIPKNTNIPFFTSQIFSTAVDNQTQVGIKVFQGEREIAEANKFLGEFVLTGIPPAPRGIPEIEVSFDIDANGIVNVNAKDMATGKEQQITIESKSGLTDEEIELMKEDAKIHAEEDQMRKDLVNLKNEADTTINLINGAMKELGDELDVELRVNAEELVNEMNEAVKGDDLKEIKTKLDDLKEIQFKISELSYKQKQEENEKREREYQEQQEKNANVENEDVVEEEDA